MATAYGARNYVGAAPATTLNGAINNSATAFDLTDGTSWPSTNFFMVIDPGTSSEEMVFVATRTGNALTSVTRGDDNTTGVSHSSGAVCRHDIAAQDLSEANDIASAMTTNGDIIVRAAGVPSRLAVGAAGTILRVVTGAPAWSAVDPSMDLITTAGDLLYGTAADTLARLAIGTAGQVLTVNAGATAPAWTTHPLRLLDNDATDTTKTNGTTTETTLATLNIGASDAAAGVIYRVVAWGTISGDATQNVQFRTKIAGTSVTSETATMTPSTTTQGFILESHIACTGSAAQTSCMRATHLDTAGVGLSGSVGTSTVNMAGAVDITITIEWSNTTGSDNTITLTHAFLERLAA